MYFNNTNNFFHGIMFHHFHDGKIHKKGQGSISKDEFCKLINFIGRSNILDANIFFEKFKDKKLKPREVCFTFDDSIKCQIDIALPVLEDFKIKSFFFTYTSLFEKKPDNLEVFRYFRMNYFKNIDEFYINFYLFLEKDLSIFFKNNENFIKVKKKKFPYYSVEDIKFRLVRDLLINKSEYEKVMLDMMKEKKFNPEKFYSSLFFSKKDIINLDKLGHSIGLHSHNHPILIEKLSYEKQKTEYEKCKHIISNILNKPKSDIKFMSHPCGSYSQETLRILKELDIELGFKQIMTVEPEKGMKKINNSPLELARQDHSMIIKQMEK